MAGKSAGKFLVVIAIIAFLAYLAVYGMTVFNYKIPPTLQGIKKGLDLTGGSVITYEADAPEVTDDQMQSVSDVMRRRLDNLNFFEATVTRQGTNRIRIEIPTISDPEQAMKTLGQTALLTFVDADGNVILSGKDKHIVGAKADFKQVSQAGNPENIVVLKFNDEGKSKFAEATEKAATRSGEQKNFIAIKLDETSISEPRVSERIDSNEAIISGNFTPQSAGELANLINSGNLPFALKSKEVRTVGPTLGDKALDTSLKAGGVGILLVLLFMLFYYRLPGLMANIALIGYTSTVALILGLSRFNLSLAGIAGIILSIGMAVDANVIIFERIKEELRAGKTLRASVDAGFNRAFSAIMDSNVTTLIAAVVLYIFGTGGIKGFAFTLGLGIVVSMFAAIVVTKFLMHQIIGMNIKNSKLYSA